MVTNTYACTYEHSHTLHDPYAQDDLWSKGQKEPRVHPACVSFVSFRSVQEIPQCLCYSTHLWISECVCECVGETKCVSVFRLFLLPVPQSYDTDLSSPLPWPPQIGTPTPQKPWELETTSLCPQMIDRLFSRESWHGTRPAQQRTNPTEVHSYVFFCQVQVRIWWQILLRCQVSLQC